MIECHDRGYPPFEIGQLVRFVEHPEDQGIDIVLDIQWHKPAGPWQVRSLSQRTGIVEWCCSSNFESVEENDDNL